VDKELQVERASTLNTTHKAEAVEAAEVVRTYRLSWEDGPASGKDVPSEAEEDGEVEVEVELAEVEKSHMTRGVLYGTDSWDAEQLWGAGNRL
jgi:hypothetical protein